MPTNRLVEKEEIATYAKVLYDGVMAAGGQEAALAVRDEAEQIVRAMRSNPKLDEALSNKAFSAQQRNELVHGIFAGCNETFLDVLGVMVERNEVDYLSRVMESYGTLLQEKLNVTIVDVTTVVELDDHLRDVITKKVAADFGTEIVLREHIDSSIIGGILMTANGKRIDASVLAQLESARTVLKQTADGGEC